MNGNNSGRSLVAAQLQAQVPIPLKDTALQRLIAKPIWQ